MNTRRPSVPAHCLGKLLLKSYKFLVIITPHAPFTLLTLPTTLWSMQIHAAKLHFYNRLNWTPPRFFKSIYVFRAFCLPCARGCLCPTNTEAFAQWRERWGFSRYPDNRSDGGEGQSSAGDIASCVGPEAAEHSRQDVRDHTGTWRADGMAASLIVELSFRFYAKTCIPGWQELLQA